MINDFCELMLSAKHLGKKRQFAILAVRRKSQKSQVEAEVHRSFTWDLKFTEVSAWKQKSQLATEVHRQSTVSRNTNLADSLVRQQKARQKPDLAVCTRMKN